MVPRVGGTQSSRGLRRIAGAKHTGKDGFQVVTNTRVIPLVSLCIYRCLIINFPSGKATMSTHLEYGQTTRFCCN